MDKLMSFFMICYLVMWLQRNEGVLWFMRGCFLLVAFSGIGGGIHAQINGVLLGYQRGQYGTIPPNTTGGKYIEASVCIVFSRKPRK